MNRRIFFIFVVLLAVIGFGGRAVLHRYETAPRLATLPVPPPPAPKPAHKPKHKHKPRGLGPWLFQIAPETAPLTVPDGCAQTDHGIICPDQTKMPRRNQS